MLGGFNAATGIVKLALDTGTFEQDSKKLNTTLESNLNVINKLDTAAKGFLLGASAGLAFFLNEASQAQEVIQKFDQVFKEESDAANEFVNDMAATLGRSKTDLKSYMSTLQDTFVPLGFGRAEARKLSQSLVALSLDLAAFNDMSDDDVIRDLQSALVGNTETVRKYGIVISETALKQEAFAKGMNPNALTEAEKAMLRFNMILAGSKDAIGTAERESSSFAGQMKVLKAGLQETAEAIGGAFLPDAEEMLGTINEIVPRLLEWVQANKELLVNNVKLAAQIAAAIVVFRMALTIIMALRTAFIALATAQAGLGLGLAALGPLALALVATGVAMAFLNDEIRKATASFDEFDGKVQGIGKSLSDAKEILKAFNTELNDPKSKARDFSDIERAAIDLRNANKELQQVKKDARTEFESQTGGVARPFLDQLAGVKPQDLDAFIDPEKYAAAVAKLKEAQKAFENLNQESKKQEESAENLNRLKISMEQLDKMILANTEKLGAKTDSQVEKIKRMVSETIKELEARRAIQTLALSSKDISAKEAEERNKVVTAINDEIKRVKELGDTKVKAAEEAAAKKEKAEIAAADREKKRISDSFLDFTQTEKEKSKRFIEEEAARLTALATTEEQKKRIAAAAKKKISEIGGDTGVRSGGVAAFEALQKDILRNEDEGVKLQKEGNAILEKIEKNTEKSGGMRK